MKPLKFNTNVYLKTLAIALILCITSLISNGSSRIKAQNGINSGSEIQEVIFPEVYSLNGEWIYYISLYDSRLYRMNRSGNTKESITTDRAREYGLIVLGGWIYYINSDDGNCLYRININGTEKVKISSEALKDSYGDFFLMGNYIYYYEGDDDIFKHNIISGEIEELDENEADFIRKFTPQSKLYNGVLYYTNSEGIFEMNIQSQRIGKICSANVYGDIMAQGKWIYYIDSEDLRLNRIDIDTHKNERVSNGSVVTVGADYDSGSFYLDDNHVYYIDTLEDGAKALLRFNGEDKTISVVQMGVEHFMLADDYLYYIDKANNGGLFRIKKDGTDYKKITSGDFIPYIDVREDVIFYMLKSENEEQPVLGRLFKIRIDGDNKSEIR